MEKITEISERLAEILSSAGTTPNNFAKLLGYTRSQTVYDILNGKSAPSCDFFKRFIHSEFSVIYSLEWLITGEGKMTSSLIDKLTPDEQSAVVERVTHGDTISDIKAKHSAETLLLDTLLTATTEKSGQLNAVSKRIVKLERENSELNAKASLCDRYYADIIKQSEEIGRLKERIAQLEREGGKDVSTAHSETVARVG